MSLQKAKTLEIEARLTEKRLEMAIRNVGELKARLLSLNLLLIFAQYVNDQDAYNNGIIELCRTGK